MVVRVASIRVHPGDAEYIQDVQTGLTEQSRLRGMAMSYREFTRDELIDRFGLTVSEREGLFDKLGGAKVSLGLLELLGENVPLALAIDTEEARSGFIVAPVLWEVRRQLRAQISLFPKHSFFVDAEQGLAGYPDFLLARSPEQSILRAPVVVVAEVKEDAPTQAVAQCLAAMVAAELFNRRAGIEAQTVYGAVTTGDVWRFLSLKGKKALVDRTPYFINEVDRIVGVLVHMLTADEPIAGKEAPS